MAFRKPEENRSSPSLGYRLSSNRQPGVEIANNRMPSKPRPRFSPEDMPFPRPAPMPRPMPMPMPGPMEPFRPPPGMNPMRPMMSGERQGISALTPSNIGFDRMGGPDRTLPGDIFHMLSNPSNYQSNFERMELENLQNDNIMNQLMIGEKFDPMIEAEELKRNPPYGGPRIMDILGEQEQAALDPSDYRTIMKILEAGGNPEDYMAANRGGIASLMR